jgi:hypothetical protein
MWPLKSWYQFSTSRGCVMAGISVVKHITDKLPKVEVLCVQKDGTMVPELRDPTCEVEWWPDVWELDPVCCHNLPTIVAIDTEGVEYLICSEHLTKLKSGWPLAQIQCDDPHQS